jgi:tetratricopeptide (TPR) repeat protein
VSANLVIIQLLHAPSNHAEFLRACWENLTHQQKKEIFYFLYSGKQHKTFLTILRTELNTESPFIPWTHLFAILEKIKILTPDMVKTFLGVGPEEEHGVFRINQPLLMEAWIKRKQDRLDTLKEQKETLLNSLEFAKQQGIREQRDKILTELKKLFPTDKQVEMAFHEEREFKARNTLNRISNRRNQPLERAPVGEKLDKRLIDRFAKQGLKAIKKNKSLALEMATMFLQMELYPQALMMIDAVKTKSSTVLWHELYISIEAKQFARALSVISVLKRKKDTDSDKSFSLLYFQALSLHGLGQTREARQIIKNIVKIRPHFKSATSLLLEWENDK